MIIANRQYQHQRKPYCRWPEKSYDMVIIQTGLTKKQARRMEQMLISSFTLKYLQNAINSISEGKLSDFRDEYYAIIGMIESWADPE